MNIEHLKQLGIDYDTGVKRFAGKAALYEKFLLKFSNDQNFAGLKDAIAQNDLDAAFRYAHTLKGVVGNLSIDRFYTTLVVLVEELRGHSTDKIESLLNDLNAQYEQIVHALQ